MLSPRWKILATSTAVLICLIPVPSRTQEPAPPAAQSPPPPPPPPVTEKPQKQKYSHTNDFLIIGTIFDPKGYAFPGVELKIRRSTEKKFRWDSYTNSRGEFAVRVPQGSDYEMIVHAKGFADQTRALDAKSGTSEARIVFRMESAGGEKK
jgi:hypothetical protein